MAAPTALTAQEEITTAFKKFPKYAKASLEKLKKESPSGDDAVIKAFLGLVMEIGSEELINDIADSKVREALSAINEVNGEPKTLIRKFISEKGLEAFLQAMSMEWLSYVAVTLGLDKIDNIKELISNILDEIYLRGLQTILRKIEKDPLKELCEALSLKVKHSSTKDELVELVMCHVFDLEPLSAADANEAKKKARLDDGSSKKKEMPGPDVYTPRGAPRPPIENIKKGMTYQQIFDLYNNTDLVDYCRQHGLSVSGKKKDHIKKILAFLDGDLQPNTPNKKKAGKAGDTKMETPGEEGGKEEEKEEGSEKDAGSK